MAEVKFLEILNDLSSAFTSGLQNVAGQDIAAQVGRAIVAIQRIGGVPEDFSLLIFPFPRLTPEALKDMPLVEEVSHVFDIGNAQFKVDVDHFGQISWLHVKGASTIYASLSTALSQAAAKGGYTNFWEY